MAWIYFDESIHERGRFVLGAFVVADRDPDPLIARALRRLGYTPGEDEYKSGKRMEGDRRLQLLRESLATILLRVANVGVLLTSVPSRPALGEQTLGALSALLSANWLPGHSHDIFFDQGILANRSDPSVIDSLSADAQCPVTLYPSEDSRLRAGLQLADLAAHYCALPVLEHLGILQKTIKAGPHSGYDPDLDIELGWAKWAELRWYILNSGLPPGREISSNMDMVVLVEGYGLFIDDSCPVAVADAARATLGQGYLGCIH